MAQKYVLSLDDQRATFETVGGKGASLARLLRAGMLVPGGFHVTTAAYERFVAENDLKIGIRLGVYTQPHLPTMLLATEPEY